VFVAARVAEQRAAYGVVEPRGEGDVVSVETALRGVWPNDADLAIVRRKVDGAALLLSRGRHEPAVRQLRQAIGGFARRRAWTDAARAAIALASAMLNRGRARDAQAVLDDARTYATHAGAEPILIDVSILCGRAWTDRARLDEAESVLGAALCAARACGDRGRIASASIALARTLFWRGRYAEASASLSAVAAADDLSPPDRVRHLALSARCAVGVRDYASAMSSIRSALEAADAIDNPAAAAVAHADAALVHLAVNDLTAVVSHAGLAIRAAHAAHSPLLAVRARLLSMEANRRRALRVATLSHVQRIAARDATPEILSARCRLIADLTASRDAADAIVTRHIQATGLHALSLYAPGRQSMAGDPFVEDVLAIVRACQAADDETKVLKDVCRHIREQLRATATACVAFHRGEYSIAAADGARLDTAIAARAVASSIVIAPHLAGERIEAAAPVHYGGAVVGAVCARWTVGSTSDRSRASTMLTTAAAACAPILASAIARRERPIVPGSSGLSGVTELVDDLRRAVERAAAAPFAVLIEGESGSGKELVARAIHRSGPRRDRVFCTVNCAAMPDDLIEAELFGHARGSFTGAVADRPGVFEEAHGGTLFLDEVGELSPRAQAKLLRVIQEGELRRIGENVSRRVDARLLAATNRDLRQEVAAGRFRLDLLYRLDVIRISVPPLRDRREDIPVLAEQFWRDATARIGSRATLGAAAIAALARYDWPGNVRELQNVLASLAVRSAKRGVVPVSALPPPFAETEPGEIWRLDVARRTFEERFVRAALVRTGGHRGRAAAELGVTRQGLTKLMARLGISV
jgi:transcriptional regulator with GAF, ATPase, and Fis domain